MRLHASGQPDLDPSLSAKLAGIGRMRTANASHGIKRRGVDLILAGK
jgi:hypothetical protein